MMMLSVGIHNAQPLKQACGGLEIVSMDIFIIEQ